MYIVANIVYIHNISMIHINRYLWGSSQDFILWNILLLYEVFNWQITFPFLGTFDGKKPVLIILDTDLIKAIMIRDFDHFTDRNTLSGREVNYLQRSLLNLKVSIIKCEVGDHFPVG